MTIAKRLIFLLAVPLAVLLALGFTTRQEMNQVEASTRYVAESRIIALARLGDISRAYAEMAISTRISILDTDTPTRMVAQTKSNAARAEVKRLLE